MMANAQLRLVAADRDPDEVVSVEEAHRLLGVGRSTLYRLDALRRVRVSPGRVGYRVGDLVEHLRRGLDDRSPFAGVSNLLVVPAAGDILPDQLLELPARVNTLIRRKSPGLAIRELVIELPGAREWYRNGHRELVLIDYDSLNSVTPTVVVAQEDENIGGRKRLILTQAGALVRLLPLVGDLEKMPDGWWVA